VEGAEREEPLGALAPEHLVAERPIQAVDARLDPGKLGQRVHQVIEGTVNQGVSLHVDVCDREGDQRESECGGDRDHLS
jgi:hypothetical protein